MTQMVECVINGKYPLIIPDHRAARPDWQPEYGCWEGPRTDALHDRVQAGDVVYYVGAEEGEFPALCQLWGAETYLLEPNPKVWSTIKAVWDANGLSTPLCFQGFASNTTELLGTEPAWAWPACADEQIQAAHGFKELHLEAQHYPQIRLDELPRYEKPPTILSFDVEGSEFQVVRGAQAIIENHHPTIFASIHPEMMALHWGEWSRDLRNWIIDRGYRETILDFAHELHCLYEPR